MLFVKNENINCNQNFIESIERGMKEEWFLNNKTMMDKAMTQNRWKY